MAAERPKSELERLIAAQALDRKIDARRPLRGKTSSSRDNVGPAPKEIAVVPDDLDERVAGSLNLPTGRPGEDSHRDAPKRGRRGKVRKGTRRLVFRDAGLPGLVLHVDGFTTKGGQTDTEGLPLKPPKDWIDAAVRVVAGAKLALLSHREVPDEQLAGVPDPTGSPIVDLGGGAFQFVGGGQARAETMLEKIRRMGFVPPPWLVPDLLDVLVRMTSFASGSRGQISARRLAWLLRRPHELRRHLMARAGNSLVAKAIAKNLPQKPRSKRRKRA